MRFVWILVGTIGGVGIGAFVGFGLALIAMSFATNANDGTYGMREVLVCLPLGVVTGLALGLIWATKTHLFMS